MEMDPKATLVVCDKGEASFPWIHRGNRRKDAMCCRARAAGRRIDAPRVRGLGWDGVGAEAQTAPGTQKPEAATG